MMNPLPIIESFTEGRVRCTMAKYAWNQQPLKNAVFIYSADQLDYKFSETSSF